MRTISRLGSIHRRVDLDTDVEVLASKEILSIGRNNATKLWARSETLESLSRHSSSKAGSKSCRRQSEGDHDWLPCRRYKTLRVKHLDEEKAASNQLRALYKHQGQHCSQLTTFG